MLSDCAEMNETIHAITGQLTIATDEDVGTGTCDLAIYKEENARKKAEERTFWLKEKECPSPFSTTPQSGRNRNQNRNQKLVIDEKELEMDFQETEVDREVSHFFEEIAPRTYHESCLLTTIHGHVETTCDDVNIKIVYESSCGKLKIKMHLPRRFLTFPSSDGGDSLWGFRRRGKNSFPEFISQEPGDEEKSLIWHRKLMFGKDLALEDGSIIKLTLLDGKTVGVHVHKKSSDSDFFKVDSDGNIEYCHTINSFPGKQVWATESGRKWTLVPGNLDDKTEVFETKGKSSVHIKYSGESITLSVVVCNNEELIFGMMSLKPSKLVTMIEHDSTPRTCESNTGEKCLKRPISDKGKLLQLRDKLEEKESVKCVSNTGEKCLKGHILNKGKPLQLIEGTGDKLEEKESVKKPSCLKSRTILLDDDSSIEITESVKGEISVVLCDKGVGANLNLRICDGDIEYNYVCFDPQQCPTPRNDRNKEEVEDTATATTTTTAKTTTITAVTKNQTVTKKDGFDGWRN